MALLGILNLKIMFIHAIFYIPKPIEYVPGSGRLRTGVNWDCTREMVFNMNDPQYNLYWRGCEKEIIGFSKEKFNPKSC